MANVTWRWRGGPPSGLDGLDHTCRVQRRQLVLAEPENVREHAVGVLTEKRGRAGDGGLGAVQADRRDRDLRLSAPRALDLLPDAARVQAGSGEALGARAHRRAGPV